MSKRKPATESVRIVQERRRSHAASWSQPKDRYNRERMAMEEASDDGEPLEQGQGPAEISVGTPCEE